MKEKRLALKPGATKLKGTALPLDYIKMVGDVFTSNFEEGLTALEKERPNPYFVCRGTVFPDEIIMSISLLFKNHLPGTTVFASADFDPMASSPKAEDLLAACVDAAGSVFQTLLESDQEKMAQLLEGTLAAMDDVPYEWTSMDVNKRRIFVRVDKSNPDIDHLADEWLKKNDPKHAENEAKEHAEAEKLIITGKDLKKPTTH